MRDTPSSPYWLTTDAGGLIPSSGGARKLRVAGRGKGKRSGYRIIHYFAADDVPVFLLDVYSKGERVNLSRAEVNELKKILAPIAEDYRNSVKERVAKLGETKAS